MSIVVETFLTCDSRISPDCHESFGVDSRSLRGWQHRKRASKQGWLYAAKKDICPACAKKLQEAGGRHCRSCDQIREKAARANGYITPSRREVKPGKRKP